MSTVIQENPADVVILGLGVMGGDIAVKTSTAGLKVVGITQGPYWDYANDYATTKYDEWGVAFNRKYDWPLPLSTYTLRQNSNQFGLPVRRNTTGQVTSAGYGVGGAANHYGGQMGRFSPWTYQIASSTASKYGANFLSSAIPNNDIEDWPLQYNDYLPYYQDWEMAYGITGTNQEPFIPNSTFPLPPHPITPLGQAWQTAAEAVNYNPFPLPTSLASKPYVNQYGVSINACVYDGWCGEACNYACETGAKANSAFRTIPAAIKTGNFTMALDSYVFRLNLNSSKTQVTSASYYDAAGNIHVQPGTAFFLGIWGLNIPRMLNLSDIGNRYNPTTVTGSVGRGPAYPTESPARAATGVMNIGANNYPSGNALGGGITFHDLCDDNFDHTGQNFIGGSYVTIGTYSGTGPGNLAIATGGSAANIGSTYKAAQQNKFLISKLTVTCSTAGMMPPTTTNYTDLDPHYNDKFGDPLARFTIDYTGHGVKSSNYTAPLYAPILTKMGASNVTVGNAAVAGTAPPTSWNIHIRGGARIGSNSSTSVFNKWHQSWTVPNLFAGGEITDTVGGNDDTSGTHVAGTATLVAAEGIMQYLKSPGPLV